MATALRWTRPAELLIYLVPVGTISPELYDGYVRLLQAHSVQPVRGLTRPGGYAPELSPFKSFAWDDATAALRLRFVSTTDRIDAADAEDVHASARAVGVLGICHCPTTPHLGTAYRHFVDSLRHFPGLLVYKCFAFEHQFDLQSVDECAALSHLVMFPVFHELDGGATSTVTLHLGVVLDTLCVTLLMSIESAVRAALKTNYNHGHDHATGGVGADTAANFLLDTNVEPSSTNTSTSHHHQTSPFLRDSPLHSTFSSSSAAAAAAAPPPPSSSSVGGVSALFGSAEARLRRRHAARQRKLCGDYAVLLGCLPDALDHYVTAIELLREEDRRNSSSLPGDALWLAAALEGYVYCLCTTSQDRFLVEIVDKASEAVVLYARAGVPELELALVQHVAWYYATVTTASARPSGAEETLWTKRLLVEALERGLTVLPEVPSHCQIQFLVHAASMLECVGYHRKMALFLHEAAALVLHRWSRTATAVTSPTSAPLPPHQRTQDLRAALHLEQITATRLGMEARTKWEASSLRRRARRLRRLPRQRGGALPQVSLAMTAAAVGPWLVLRFHVLRQLLSIAQALGDAYLVGANCVRLLQVLAWCDTVSSLSSSSSSSASSASSSNVVDHLQTPFSLSILRGGAASARLGLHARTSGSVLATPPASLEPKTKRYFANSPSAVTSAAATLSSTIVNTPRVLLSTPRQQLSAAVNALSTKASPAFGSFTSPSGGGGGSGGATTPRSASTAELGSGQHTEPVKASTSFASPAAESSSTTAGTTIDNVSVPSAPWDLRSRAEIQQLQRSVLRLLETECAVLRPSEQLQLDAFVEVHRVRVAFDAQRNPLRSSAPSSSSSSATATAATPAFFYNPFDTANNSNNKKRSGADGNSHRQWRGSDSEDSEEDIAEEDDNDFDEGEPRIDWRRRFPALERVLVYVTVSNPLGVPIDLQQVTAWVSSSPSSFTAASSSIADTPHVETYPTSATLQPYERRRTLVLRLRPLLPGRYFIRGCIIKAVNVRTSVPLPSPRPLVVVPAAPRLRCEVRELGGLQEEKSSVSSIPASSSSSPICMFVNETKQCVLTLRNEGHRSVRSLRVGLRIGARGAERTLFDSANGSATTSMAVEAEGVAFTCLVEAGELAERLPLARGERIDLPFRIALRGARLSSALSEEPLHWTFVYSGGDDSGLVEEEDGFCRESNHAVTLVPLASLAVQHVALESVGGRGVERRANRRYCRVALDVVNPTETVFLVRVRRRVEEEEEEEKRRGGRVMDDWDVEIGRQSVRRLVVEIPRVEGRRAEEEEDIAALLNARLRIEWGTYFGTRGALALHSSLWGSGSASAARHVLMQGQVVLKIEGIDGLCAEEQDEEDTTEDAGGGLSFPFRFYQPVRHSQRRSRWTARLLEPWSFEVAVERRGGAAQASAMRVEVIIRREYEGDEGGGGEEIEHDDTTESDPAVLISGQTQRTLSARGEKEQEEEEEEEKEEATWRLRCVFLSEGKYRVDVRALWSPPSSSAEHGIAEQEEVWSHAPLCVSCYA